MATFNGATLTNNLDYDSDALLTGTAADYLPNGTSAVLNGTVDNIVVLDPLSPLFGDYAAIGVIVYNAPQIVYLKSIYYAGGWVIYMTLNQDDVPGGLKWQKSESVHEMMTQVKDAARGAAKAVVLAYVTGKGVTNHRGESDG